MTIPLLAAFLAIGLALGYGWSGAYVRAMRAETRAATAEKRAEDTEAEAASLRRTIAFTDDRLAWEECERFNEQARADLFETAFTATMMRQVRADELAPLDQARGEVISIERGRR